MTSKTHTGFLLMVLAVGLAGCSGDSATSPTAPSAEPQQAPRLNPNGRGEYVVNATLSGVVYEVTPTGRVPIEGVVVWSSEQAMSTTDNRGSFSIRPVWVCPCPWAQSAEPGMTSIQSSKDGYGDPTGQPASIFPDREGEGWRDVKIIGDTRVEIELVRQ